MNHERNRRPEPHELLENDPFVRGLARSLVLDPSRADDVVQQTYAAALSGGPLRARSLRAWLAAVVRNLAWKLRRAEARRDAHERAAARPEALPSVEEIVAREQIRRLVVEAVLRLDEPARTAMLLRYFERLPPREIARRLGVPVETVRTRIKRSIEKLRADLDREHGGDRGSWLPALAPFALPAPAGPIAGAAAAAASAAAAITTGVLLMSAKTKLLGAAAIGAAGLLAWAAWNGDAGDEHALPRTRAEESSIERAPAASVAANDPAPEPEPAAVRTVIEAEPEPTPEAATPRPELGSVAVHAVWQRDGTSAAGVVVSLYVWRRADPYLFLPSASTDEAGVVRFVDLEPGHVLAVGDRSGRAAGKVIAGETTEIELLLEDGVDVEGEVVDGAGAPVPGADIWLAFDGAGCTNGSVVTRSDGNGRFQLDSVNGIRNIGARKAGFAPSDLQWVRGDAGTSIEIRIELSEPGGVVRGRVIDPDGAPVEGAIVQLGDEHKQLWSPAGARHSTPFKRLLRAHTDSDGRFAFEGAMTGDVPLVVRARALAPWTGTIAVHPGSPVDKEIALVRGATLEGTVKDGDARPIEGATVRVGDRNALATTETRTSADGGYRIEHLMPGRLDVHAEHEESGRRDDATIAFADGATARFDAVLASGLVIRGRVLEASGQPAAGFHLEAFGTIPGDRNSWYSQRATADENGSFAFEGCPENGVSLEVHSPEYGHSSAAWLPKVLPSDEETVIRVPDGFRCSVTFEGAVVGPDGTPVPNADVTPIRREERRPGATYTTTEAGTGRFSFGPYAPGRYELRVSHGDFAPARVDLGEVVAGETRDVGVVRLARGVPLEVWIRTEDGSVPDGFHALGREMRSGAYVDLREDGDVLRAARVGPGTYEVVASAPGFVSAIGEIEVEAEVGEPAVLDLVLRRGVAIELGVELSAALRDRLSRGNPQGWMRLENSRGEGVTRLFLGSPPTDPWRADLLLEPGRHGLELEIDGEPAGRAEFEVPASGATEPIRVAFE